MNIAKFFESWNHAWPSLAKLSHQLIGSSGTTAEILSKIGHVEIDKVDTVKVRCDSFTEVGKRFKTVYDLSINGKTYRVYP